MAKLLVTQIDLQAAVGATEPATAGQRRHKHGIQGAVAGICRGGGVLILFVCPRAGGFLHVDPCQEAAKDPARAEPGRQIISSIIIEMCWYNMNV